MVEANLKIIKELKIFLSVVSQCPEIRRLVTQKESDFSRERKLTLERIVGIIINLPKRSLSIELQEFFNSIGQMNGCTKGAFSLQRGKLDPLFFQVWNKWLVDFFYFYYGDHAKRWRGFRVQAVDGSTAYLLNQKEVVDYFGTHANQHSTRPLARIMQIQDVLNDITVWGDIYPIKEAEQTIMANQVSRLYEDSLTLFDRGFAGYPLLYLLMNEETPRHFVMRCRVGFNKETKQFIRSTKNSKIIELSPNSSAIKTLYQHGYIITPETKIKVRMVKLTLPTGEQEILLTNLYDSKLYSIADLQYLYSLRWGIETTYGKQKNQQQMEQFSGHRVICIQQDYAAGLFAANLQSLVEKQCEGYLEKISRSRKYRYKVNRNVSWASLKHNIVKLFLLYDPVNILQLLQKDFERNIEPIRPGRQYPRVRKAKRLTGKYQTFTNYKRAI